eukprot:CAMPEP_0206553630 /NCGR_PEP_ID=MMETSP0325_2-20121206/16736_1 /ASSEMBLY_ACC=CAM_ASM_000347 /TAXON_ID=2866 /ORGANISM="Crypthecodinium cohnii, Strain Seligo" /LENGTH=90 /DNA_ID=CAMNT_0054053623 /DNA_START=280 /DNA_END=549 /DNA_ORIENTATION=+
MACVQSHWPNASFFCHTWGQILATLGSIAKTVQLATASATRAFQRRATSLLLIASAALANFSWPADSDDIPALVSAGRQIQATSPCRYEV